MYTNMYKQNTGEHTNEAEGAWWLQAIESIGGVVVEGFDIAGMTRPCN